MQSRLSYIAVQFGDCCWKNEIGSVQKLQSVKRTAAPCQHSFKLQEYMYFFCKRLGPDWVVAGAKSSPGAGGW